MPEVSLLIVDDEKAQREALAGFFQKKGYTVWTAGSGTEAVGVVQKEVIDVVLTDFKMPGLSGHDVLKKVKSINPEVVVILMTAFGSIEGAVDAMKSGAFNYVSKPVNLEALQVTVEKAIERKHLISENYRLKEALKERHRFEGILYASGAMAEVLSTAARVAKADASVIILGESGTGKELVANAIHYASDRKDGALVVVNCAALTETLLESELFGHEKGAFTGADKKRIGRFEQAHGGTLFIDEIGEIPLRIQVKLLRFLQEGTFERVGSNDTLRSDVRILAATNRDLLGMTQNGSFREDLYYRLNVVSIQIPPLRERREDLPLLIDDFMRKNAERNGKQIDGVSKEALDALMKYEYPGNVRELENIVERAVVLSRDKIIGTRDLPVLVRPVTEDEVTNFPDLNRTLEENVQALEIVMIETALEKSEGVQTKAADLLKITERNLRYKIKKYGLR